MNKLMVNCETREDKKPELNARSERRVDRRPARQTQNVDISVDLRNPRAPLLSSSGVTWRPLLRAARESSST